MQQTLLPPCCRCCCRFRPCLEHPGSLASLQVGGGVRNQHSDYLCRQCWAVLSNGQPWPEQAESAHGSGSPPSGDQHGRPPLDRRQQQLLQQQQQQQALQQGSPISMDMLTRSISAPMSGMTAAQAVHYQTALHQQAQAAAQQQQQFGGSAQSPFGGLLSAQQGPATLGRRSQSFADFQHQQQQQQPGVPIGGGYGHAGRRPWQPASMPEQPVLLGSSDDPRWGNLASASASDHRRGRPIAGSSHHRMVVSGMGGASAPVRPGLLSGSMNPGFNGMAEVGCPPWQGGVQFRPLAPTATLWASLEGHPGSWAAQTQCRGRSAAHPATLRSAACGGHVHAGPPPHPTPPTQRPCSRCRPRAQVPGGMLDEASLELFESQSHLLDPDSRAALQKQRQMLEWQQGQGSVGDEAHTLATSLERQDSAGSGNEPMEVRCAACRLAGWLDVVLGSGNRGGVPRLQPAGAAARITRRVHEAGCPTLRAPRWAPPPPLPPPTHPPQLHQAPAEDGAVGARRPDPEGQRAAGAAAGQEAPALLSHSGGPARGRRAAAARGSLEVVSGRCRTCPGLHSMLEVRTGGWCPRKQTRAAPAALPCNVGPQEREGLRQQVRQLEDKCREFQEAVQCKICRAVRRAGGCAGRAGCACMAPQGVAWRGWVGVRRLPGQARWAAGGCGMRRMLRAQSRFASVLPAEMLQTRPAPCNAASYPHMPACVPACPPLPPRRCSATAWCCPACTSSTATRASSGTAPPAPAAPPATAPSPASRRSSCIGSEGGRRRVQPRPRGRRSPSRTLSTDDAAVDSMLPGKPCRSGPAGSGTCACCSAQLGSSVLSVARNHCHSAAARPSTPALCHWGGSCF